MEPSPAERPPARGRRGVGPFSLRQVTLVVGAAFLAAVVLAVATAPIGPSRAGLPDPAPSAYLLGSPIPGLAVGAVAPELDVPTLAGGRFGLADLDGRPIRLADLRGRVVWLDFWASWCPPCRAETPVLRALDERYRSRGLTLIAVEVQQTVDEGRRYAAAYGLRYQIGADLAGDVFRAYRVFALPTQFLIDPDGVIRKVINGPVDDATAGALVEALLPAATGGPSPSPSP